MSYQPTKPLIEQVVENAQFIAACPSCSDGPNPGLADAPANQMGPGNNGLHKRGKWRGLPRNSWPVCDFCKGLGIVYLNRICECGYPAVLYDGKGKVWYCGHLACLSHAVWRVGLSSNNAAQSWSGL